jgi:hypothetical protein
MMMKKLSPDSYIKIDLSNRTIQDIFDEVCVFQGKQKKKSLLKFVDKYGNKCAVGSLIPNDKYEKWMDEAYENMSEVIFNIFNVKDSQLHFLYTLQLDYDDSESLDELKENLEKNNFIGKLK